MSAKEIVLETVGKMSDRATMDEIAERIAILAAIRRGEEKPASSLFIHIGAMERAWHVRFRNAPVPRGDDRVPRFLANLQCSTHVSLGHRPMTGCQQRKASTASNS
jgi:hypothetical protein